MKAYRNSRGLPHSSLISALDRGEWSTSRPGRFTHTKEPPLSTEYEAVCALQSRSGHLEKEKKFLSSARLRTPARLVRLTRIKLQIVIMCFSVGSEVLKAVTMKLTVMWEMTSCSAADINVSPKFAASINKVDV
jgi:hypothetical protein